MNKASVDSNEEVMVGGLKEAGGGGSRKKWMDWRSIPEMK